VFYIPAGQVSNHIRRIEAVEKELKALTESAAGKDDVSRVRTEMKKLYDGLHVGMPMVEIVGTQHELMLCQLRRIS
jgi:hypothetical protein